MYHWPIQLSSVPDIKLAAGPAAAGPTARLSERGLVLPPDSRYDRARKTYNSRYGGLRPWGVAYCAADQDAAAWLDFALGQGLPFRIRAGGHSFAGQSSVDAGLVIDIAGLNDIRIDPDRLEVTVGAGCTMSALGQALRSCGLTLPMGGGPVGVGGFVQGGGFAADRSRTLGLNSDHVLALWVLLADGRTVYASETINHDLWWAIRGGTGGNFGILLAVRYAVQALPAPLDWSLSWPVRVAADRQRAVKVIGELQSAVVANADSRLNVQWDLRRWPETSGGPPQTMRLVVAGTFFGSQQALDAAIAPLRAIAGTEPPFNRFASSPTLAVLRQSRFIRAASDSELARLIDDFVDTANPHTTLTVDVWGGEIAAYPLERSAFVHRGQNYNIYVTGFWDDDAEQRVLQAYLERWRHWAQPLWNGEIYQNFADPDCPDYRSNYWGRAFPALLAVKRKYDPQQRFTFAQVIEGPAEPVLWPPGVVDALARPIRF